MDQAPRKIIALLQHWGHHGHMDDQPIKGHHLLPDHNYQSQPEHIRDGGQSQTTGYNPRLEH